MKKIASIFLLAFTLLLRPLYVSGEMSSSNYTIFADDFHSGIVASSTNYQLKNTTGETPTGMSTSSSYNIKAGFQAMDKKSLSLDISNTSLDLGDLTIDSLSTASASVTVSAESEGGYTLAISGVSWSGEGGALNDVSGTVEAGNEEYGYAISGTDVSSGLLSSDNPVQAGVIMSSSTSVTSASSTLTFKASIDELSTSGQRTQTITFTLSSKF